MSFGRTIGSNLRSGWLAIPLFAAVCAALSGTASAADITYSSVTGSWRDPVDNLPGSQPGDPVITNGNPTSIIVWGDTMGTPQSGYDFTATVPPPFTLPGPIPFFSLGSFTHRNFEVDDPSLDLGSARCRPRDQRGRRPTRSVDVHLHVQPHRDAEQRDALSVSDTARRRVHGPCADRRVTFAHDVQRRWRGLHAVDELPQQRQSGVRVHHARRRHDQQLGSRRAIHVAESAARHAGAHDGQVGPGDDESGRARRFHARACRTSALPTRST